MLWSLDEELNTHLQMEEARPGFDVGWIWWDFAIGCLDLGGFSRTFTSGWRNFTQTTQLGWRFGFLALRYFEFMGWGCYYNGLAITGLFQWPLVHFRWSRP